jgi:tellurite resistance protein TerC
VFAANAFSLLGLMSLYFLLAGAAQMFRYLNIGLAAILVFVGIKMLITDLWHVPTILSLGFIVLALSISIFASIRAARKEEQTKEDEKETAAV